MKETFAGVVVAARKIVGLSQKDLAAMITKVDGTSISTTYLNDIERGRRRPSEQLVKQFAEALDLEMDYLSHMLGIVPPDLVNRKVSKKQVLSAYEAFRKELDK